MGNSTSSGARRKLGDAIHGRVFKRNEPEPLTSAQKVVMDQLAEREQERLKDLPSLEQINAKDTGLDQLLNKLSVSVSGRLVDVSGGQGKQRAAGAASPSGRDGQEAAGVQASRPNPTSAGNRASAAASAAAGVTGVRGNRKTEDEEDGRLPSFILRDLLERKNAVNHVGEEDIDLKAFAATTGADAAALEKLLEHCCIPQVGKVETFGHQYAYARAPLWWRGQVSGNRFKSEPAPWEKMIRKKPIESTSSDAAGPAEGTESAQVAADAPPPQGADKEQAIGSSHPSQRKEQ